MNLDRCVELFSRLPIKHKRTGVMVRFVLNTNQQIFTGHLKKQYAEIGMTRAIVLKSRRVGISSETDGLLLLHGIAIPNAHNRIVAHLANTSEALFRVPRDLANGFPYSIGDVMTKKIHIRHNRGNSLLEIATAGKESGGRGLTLSALHLSEAAQFPAEDSFTSLLSAVSEGPNTIIVIESTAHGRVGIGQPFYDFWNDAVAGRNGYIPIFISWLDDPECIADEEEAADAPLTDLERELMGKPFYATRAQIAWMRGTLANKCQGLEPKFNQEYPHTPEVAFVATGDPAFPREEILFARSTVSTPMASGHLEWDGNKPRFIRNPRGLLRIWEEPQKDNKYYIGADAAQGVEHGDFASYAVINGSTGEQAARFADRIHPEALADQLAMACQWYNRAMHNIELTGGLGRETVRIMRDRYHYPNYYVWKGKDDKIPGKQRSIAMGWEMNSYSRKKLFDTFRGAIRSAMQNEHPCVIIRDEALVSQMDNATRYEGWNWEVTKGHDDILVATMLAVVACVQYPPPRIQRNKKILPLEDEEETFRSMAPRYVEDAVLSLQRHYKQVMDVSSRKNKFSPLDGI